MFILKGLLFLFLGWIALCFLGFMLEALVLMIYVISENGGIRVSRGTKAAFLLILVFGGILGAAYYFETQTTPETPETTYEQSLFDTVPTGP